MRFCVVSAIAGAVYFCCDHDTYNNMQKSAHGWNTLQVSPREGWVLLGVSTFSLKRVPMSCLSHLMDLKQIINVYILEVPAFEVMSQWHTTLRMAVCHHVHDATSLNLLITPMKYKTNFSPQISKVLETEIHKLYKCTLANSLVMLTPGWVFIWVIFDPKQKIGPKVGGGRSFLRLPYM